MQKHTQRARRHPVMQTPQPLLGMYARASVNGLASCFLLGFAYIPLFVCVTVARPAGALGSPCCVGEGDRSSCFDFVVVCFLFVFLFFSSHFAGRPRGPGSEAYPLCFRELLCDNYLFFVCAIVHVGFSVRFFFSHLSIFFSSGCERGRQPLEGRSAVSVITSIIIYK